jgi:hypothetical protein
MEFLAPREKLEIYTHAVGLTHSRIALKSKKKVSLNALELNEQEISWESEKYKK